MRFTRYEVVPLRDLGEHAEECEDHEADYWGLFGVDPETPDVTYAIGDFSDRSSAEFIRDAIQASQ